MLLYIGGTGLGSDCQCCQDAASFLASRKLMILLFQWLLFLILLLLLSLSVCKCKLLVKIVPLST